MSSLKDNTKIAKPYFDQDEVLWIDDWEEKDWDASGKPLKTDISPLLKELLGKIGVVNIKRQDLDAALWNGDPAKRVPTAKHQSILKKLGLDHNQFELRCIRQDEYARLHQIRNLGNKNLWTNFDNYFLEDGGDRLGLLGGRRANGGASHVGDGSWGDFGGNLAVRLVLARKQV